MVMEMLRAGEVREDDDQYQSPLDELFERLEMKNPEHIAVKYYKDYHSGSAKTLKSIQITLAARLEKFNLSSLAALTATDGLELMMALFNIIQGVTSTIMQTAGFGSTEDTVLPDEIIEAVEDCGFFESIPLWAVTLIGGLFITVLSFIMIMSVYGRFFRLYLYTAIAPIPLSSFAGEPSQNIGRSFLKSYAAVCLEGAIVVLACIIFSLFASSPPVVNPDAAAVTMVWSYIGELIFNMLVLVGAVKMSDRVVREMMGL